MTPPLTLENLLSGGDLRSTGAADESARELLAGVWDVHEFLELLQSSEPVVRMRAADALEKATRRAPELIAGAGQRLLPLLASPQPKEVRWHLLQMAPRVKWTDQEHSALLLSIEEAFADASAIVQTSALQALAELSHQSGLYATPLQARLSQASSSALPSLRARARRLARTSGP